jgi:plasmid stabilization system protein ParE
VTVEVVWSAGALIDLDRFGEFLLDEHPRMAAEIAAALKAKSQLLADFPYLGRAVGRRPDYRRLFVTALNTVYSIDYRVDERRARSWRRRQRPPEEPGERRLLAFARE